MQESFLTQCSLRAAGGIAISAQAIPYFVPNAFIKEHKLEPATTTTIGLHVGSRASYYSIIYLSY